MRDAADRLASVCRSARPSTFAHGRCPRSAPGVRPRRAARRRAGSSESATPLRRCGRPQRRRRRRPVRRAARENTLRSDRSGRARRETRSPCPARPLRPRSRALPRWQRDRVFRWQGRRSFARSPAEMPRLPARGRTAPLPRRRGRRRRGLRPSGRGTRSRRRRADTGRPPARPTAGAGSTSRCVSAKPSEVALDTSTRMRFSPGARFTVTSRVNRPRSSSVTRRSRAGGDGHVVHEQRLLEHRRPRSAPPRSAAVPGRSVRRPPRRAGRVHSDARRSDRRELRDVEARHRAAPAPSAGRPRRRKLSSTRSGR